MVVAMPKWFRSEILPNDQRTRPLCAYSRIERNMYGPQTHTLRACSNLGTQCDITRLARY